LAGRAEPTVTPSVRAGALPLAARHQAQFPEGLIFLGHRSDALEPVDLPFQRLR
jgi:hypothetical protein